MANQNDRLLVPYITTWSAEETIPGVIIHAPRYGIAYSNETINDRDVHGILWTRTQSSPGQGRPLFGKVHSLRQRRAMHRLLCQVCAGPADQDERGTLWLMLDHRDDWPDWPELMATVDPPICLRCAHTSRRLCPALRNRYVAVRVGRSTLSGIYGIRYRPSALLPEAVEPVTIAFDSPFASWVCASQLVRELHDCVIVDLS